MSGRRPFSKHPALHDIDRERERSIVYHWLVGFRPLFNISFGPTNESQEKHIDRRPQR